MYHWKRTPLALAFTIGFVILAGSALACGGPPVALFKASVTGGQAPLVVTFVNESTGAEEFTWEFGDGETKTTNSTKETVTHAYKKAGAHTLKLTAGKKGQPATANSSTATITVAPAALASIMIAPAEANVGPEGKQAFTAEARDSFGNIIPDAKFAFKSNEMAGRVDPSGAFVAGRKAGSFDGAVSVEATQGNTTKSASARVTINTGPLDHVLVTPSKTELAIGKTQDFTAAPMDAFDNPVAGAQVSWTVDGAAGTIEAGKLTAGSLARTFERGVTATARIGTLSTSGSASVTVKPDPLDSITVQDVRVAAGATQQLRAEAKDRHGNQLSDVQVAWSVLSQNAGVTTAGGMLTAGLVARTFPNVIQAKVTQGDIAKTASAQVVIVPGPLAQVVVGPGQIDLGIGMTQQFVAVSADQYGNRISGLSFTWSVESGGGSIDSKGLFTASNTPGAYGKTVKAAVRQGDNSRSGTANVSVAPDQIAFVSNRDNENFELYTMNTDGSDVKRLTKTSTGLKYQGIGGGASWSPDGRLIAYDQIGNTVITDDRASSSSLLTNNKTTDGIGAFSPAWSPDGKRVVFTTVVGKDAAAQFDLYAIDIDGGNLARLTNTAGAEFSPRWSPDGKRIVYDYSAPGGQGDIWTMDPDGKNARVLASNPGNDTAPEWSPDGRQIAFMSNNTGNYEIFVMNADGTAIRQLTANNSTDSGPSWSPDGKRIAFASERDTPGHSEIYVMNADGTGVVRLTNNDKNDVDPVWAPRKSGVAVSPASVVVPGSKALRPLSIELIASVARKAVVRIETDLGTGSGFLIDPNGLVMTANHVVAGAKTIGVTLDDGRKFSATLKGRDLVRDVALVQIPATGLPILPHGDLGQSALGQQVVVLGYPLGSKEITVTSGLFSALRTDGSRSITWIQTDTAVNAGNSGGPLLNLQGAVIGIVTKKRIQTGVEGVGLAVSISSIDPYLARLRSGETLFE